MLFKGLSAFLQLLLDALAMVLSVACKVFPPSPFHLVLTGVPANVFAAINYFVPLGEIVAILETWLIAVGAYYLISIVARWLKAIE